jgi:Zn-dependent peptidase ImmA (M78 family)
VKGNADRLKKRLKKIGLSDPAITAAWPSWWSDEADASPSAQAELRFSLARKLGLDPHSLLEEESQPRFIWRDEAKFKNLANENEMELAAITSFATAVSKYLLEAAGKTSFLGKDQLSAKSLRKAILARQPFVRLLDLLSVCWAFGIPVIHLRVFPALRKRMAAMTIRVGDRNAIMLGKDSMYPPHIAFYLAHELAHIALGHLSRKPIVVDLESTNHMLKSNDPEEMRADSFALQLLTGKTSPVVLPKWSRYSARALASTAIESATELGIEPGTLALCFAFSTGDWPTANAAMRTIYTEPQPAWSVVNKLAIDQLDLEAIPQDARSYLMTILGEA